MASSTAAGPITSPTATRSSGAFSEGGRMPRPRGLLRLPRSWDDRGLRRPASNPDADDQAERQRRLPLHERLGGGGRNDSPGETPIGSLRRRVARSGKQVFS